LTKHAKAARFKRNDQMLDVLPIEGIVFPGTSLPVRPVSRTALSSGFRRCDRTLGIPA